MNTTALKRVKEEYILSEQLLSYDQCIQLYVDNGGNKGDLTVGELEIIQLSDNWKTRRGEIMLSAEQALYSARQQRFLNRKLEMDEKILHANDKLIDVAIDRLDDGDNLRVSDIERLSNTLGKAQATNNEIIGAAIAYNQVANQLSNKSGNAAPMDFSKLTKEELKSLINSQVGLIEQ